MKKPVCVKCNRTMRVAKVGAEVVELYQVDKPYKIWACEIFECPECSCRVTSNYADKPQFGGGISLEALMRSRRPESVVLEYEYGRDKPDGSK